MRRMMLALILASTCLAGCGAAMQEEYWRHESIYKNWDHMRFSWSGYREVTPEEVKMSTEQGWWGKSYAPPER